VVKGGKSAAFEGTGVVPKEAGRLPSEPIHRAGRGLFVGEVQELEIGPMTECLRCVNQDSHRARVVPLGDESCGESEGCTVSQILGRPSGEESPPAGGVSIATSKGVVPGFEAGALEVWSGTNRCKEIGCAFRVVSAGCERALQGV